MVGTGNDTGGREREREGKGGAEGDHGTLPTEKVQIHNLTSLGEDYVLKYVLEKKSGKE